MEHKKNDEIFERACKSIAGGLNTNFKKDKGSKPVYVKSVDGIKITDFDDNVYYDYALTFGPAILGHSNKRYQEALKQQIDRLYTDEFGMITIETAERIKELIPHMELMRFSLTGNEANSMAVRVARAYTQKNMMVKFNGHFNGGPDYIVGGIVANPDNPVVSDGFHDYDGFSQMCSTHGRAKHAFDDVYMIEWNDLDAITKLFEKHGDDIACVIMEPIAVNVAGCIAEPGYMEGVRALCTKHKVVLIFDEVLAGFRVGIGGCAAFYGVTPDMSTFSKAIGGGFPVSVYGGKREIMDTITSTEVLAPGTFNGHPLGCAAISATLEQLTENDGAAYRHIEKLSNRLREGFLESVKKYDVPVILQGFPGALVPVFTRKEKIINHYDNIHNTHREMVGPFSALLKKHGIMNNFRLCVSLAHTEEDIENSLPRIDAALAELKQMYPDY